MKRGEALDEWVQLGGPRGEVSFRAFPARIGMTPLAWARCFQRAQARGDERAVRVDNQSKADHGLAGQRRRARRRRAMAARVMRDGRWFAPGPDLEHGTRNIYDRYGCRCEPCCRAETEHRERQWTAA